ncbi:16S rRNA (cytosine(967)-C(5))-methyltransferase [Alicyclobacillus hesperidum]|uniref:16S rRNA (cytosine(967)-C(5))-methyltransferase n=1 Tax=Alicyclobacillus hesperidum TaxID=89784 RepID=A0A1H2UXM5_9BACL|nr:16S rRNA (cytosine(967)-C(5))-methyltransferase RsmB [Alicyclobacillus hesperidum]GLV14611.1 16S rRNA (cytosine(967)-C(5))-methyltransferase [Alicyclobacillus hesperidum]SDW60389.1 16S rRNA (cytosine967-C5)-methyltransferase [Alicyclobacillus hesperidum]
MISPARWTAYHALVRVAKDRAYVNLALQQALAKRELSDRDKALATEIAYGTVRRQLTIDYLLAPYVRRGLAALEVEILTILRMSVYQLSWLSRLPAYAVTSDAVDMAKRVNPRSASFVNAVLRSYLRDGTDWESRIHVRRTDRDDIAQLSLLHSYPRWMVARLVAAYGRERAEAILAAGNRPGATAVRVNPLRASVESVASALTAQGVGEIERGALYDGALRITGAIDIERLDLYHHGSLTVQDEGAMLIAPLLRPEPGMRVLDMCAAPGGKTTQIAELMRDTGVIDAYDVYISKIQTIVDACSRLHLTSVRARLGDGRDVSGNPPYDAVLVDAPCSGLGVMRRRPDIRQRRTEADVAALTALQTDLLRHACRIVKPGGYVVYATCTLLPEENEKVVLGVVDELQGAVSLDDIAHDVPAPLAGQVAVGLTLTPDMFATDGFYMARLRRN